MTKLSREAVVTMCHRGDCDMTAKPFNVPIIELGGTRRTGKSEIPRRGEVTVGIQYFVPVLSFRGSPTWRMDPSDRMGDLDAGASPVFLVMPKRKPHPSTIHIHTYFWTFVRSSILLILGPMARTVS